MFHKKEVNYEMRNEYLVTQPKVKNQKYGIDTFSYQGARIWNMLPSDIKSCENISQFKLKIDSWDGPECLCNSCILCQINLM